jgi:hypothetical protein
MVISAGSSHSSMQLDRHGFFDMVLLLVILASMKNSVNRAGPSPGARALNAHKIFIGPPCGRFSAAISRNYLTGPRPLGVLAAGVVAEVTLDIRGRLSTITGRLAPVELETANLKRPPWSSCSACSSVGYDARSSTSSWSLLEATWALRVKFRSSLVNSKL